jgi:hypothetical protein
VPILVSERPPVPAAAEAPAEPKVRDEPTLIWQGWTGDQWVLAGDRNAGTFILEDGLGGILEPPVQHYFSENTGEGSTYQGHRTPAREVTVPIFVWAETPSEMRAEDKRFRKTLRPEHQATLIVQEPNGARRYLALRYLSGAEGSFSGETYGKHWMAYSLTLTAEDPFFYGERETRTFEGVAPVDFYVGGTAPDYVISEGNTIATAKVTNEGDEPAYVTWTVHGAMSEFTGGWPGAVIHLPIPLENDEAVTVYTDPRDGRIIDQAGTSRWSEVLDEDIEFGPLPAGEEIELNLTVEDGDSETYVEISWVPKYRSAW